MKILGGLLASPTTGRFAQRPHLLDEIQQTLSLLAHQCLPELVAESADV
jgi:hypothetical protein